MKERTIISPRVKYCLCIWLNYCLTLFSIISRIMLFLPNFPDDKLYIKYILGCVLLLLLIVSYVIIYLYERNPKQVKLKINNNEINILFGDIFKMDGKKVIAFNEFFDTQVDDKIIAKKSLNGQVILKKFIDKDKFDKLVKDNKNLEKADLRVTRVEGKQQAYKLGQIQPSDDLFALAFTKFDDNNCAFIYLNDYVKCLLKMWSELNKQYSQNIINIPLLGSGIT